MNYPIGKKVIIRTNHAGVFFGTLSEYDAVIRTAAMQGLLAHSGDVNRESSIAKEAIIYADALVEILKGEQ